MSVSVSASGRRRRTRAQWQRILSAQSASGLTQQAYCKRHAISQASLSRWKRALSGIQPVGLTEPGPTFVELSPSAAVVGMRWEVELELGDGVYLRLRRG